MRSTNGTMLWYRSGWFASERIGMMFGRFSLTLSRFIAATGDVSTA